MIGAWRQLGLRIEHDARNHSVEVEGSGGKLPVQDAEIYVANSGTTIRFLAAALSACKGQFRLHGIPRMHERPIGDLLHAIRNLGGNIESLNPQNPECPPVQIKGAGLLGGQTTIAGNLSSQFLSGIMLAAPLAQSPVHLAVSGELVSVPYVTMTAKVMQSFGAIVDVAQVKRAREIRVENSGYLACDYSVEPDASAASYFWAAAAITGGSATVEGLSLDSLQGDVGFCRVLEQMGCEVDYGPQSITVVGRELQGVEVDMSDISDTVQTLAAVALFAKTPTRVTGVAHNRVKETDRISDLARELRKLGAAVEEFEDGLRIEPPSQITPAQIETYHDHRMAMSLSLVGLRADGIAISDPDCTGKTYPKYWSDLERFTGSRIDRRN